MFLIYVNFHKVIKVLNIKSAVSLQLTPLEAQYNSLNDIAQIECVVSFELALKSIANSLQILYLKPL